LYAGAHEYAGAPHTEVDRGRRVDVPLAFLLEK